MLDGIIENTDCIHLQVIQRKVNAVEECMPLLKFRKLHPTVHMQANLIDNSIMFFFNDDCHQSELLIMRDGKLCDLIQVLLAHVITIA